MTWLAAVLAIPLAIELIGRLLSVRDVWSVPALRPRAFQRLVAPFAAGGLLLWLLPQHAWHGLAIGVGVVVGWRLLAMAAVRIAMRHPASRTRAIDLDPASTGDPS